jgi:hypothetical protein
VGSLIRWHPRRFGSNLKGLGMGSLIRWLYGASEQVASVFPVSG